MAKDYIPYTGPVVTRDEAIAAGMTHFFTGVPCRHGHISKRYVSGTRQCMACNDRYATEEGREEAHRAANPPREPSPNDYVGPVISRNAAKKAGLKKLFTGRACSNGHLDQRWVSSNGCVVCVTQHTTKFRTERNAEHRAICRARRARDLEKHRAVQRDWAARNPEKVKEYSKRAYDKNPEAMRQRTRDYIAANLEEVRRRVRAARKADPAAKRAHYAKWYKANYGAVLANNRNRRARVKNAQGKHTIQDINQIMAAQRGKCAWCNTSLKLGYHVDHIIPLALGGSNYPKNLQLLCAPCNQSKGAKHPIEFARIEGRLL